MNYINTKTLEYPVTEWTIRSQHPNVCFPQPFVPPEDYALVFLAPATEYNPLTQGVREIQPELTQKGVWEQRWEIYQLDPELVAQNQAAQRKALFDSIVAGTQEHLDTFARMRNYDGILSLCTYATSSIPKFQVEGQYGVQARDLTWAKLYEILAEVESGTRPLPTGFLEIQTQLPPLVWPV